jgi:hypothetical protein
LQDLLNGRVPLGDFAVTVAWSLLNLILSTVALLGAAVIFYTVVRRRKDKREDEEKIVPQDEDKPLVRVYVNDEGLEVNEEIEYKPFRRRLRALKVPSIIMGIVMMVLFFLFEDITLPICWIDAWTPLFLVLFVIFAVFVTMQWAIKRKVHDEEEGDEVLFETIDAQGFSGGLEK